MALLSLSLSLSFFILSCQCSAESMHDDQNVNCNLVIIGGKKKTIFLSLIMLITRITFSFTNQPLSPLIQKCIQTSIVDRRYLPRYLYWYSDLSWLQVKTDQVVNINTTAFTAWSWAQGCSWDLQMKRPCTTTFLTQQIIYQIPY